MEIQIAREPFLRGLQLLQNVVEPRQTLPILANVLIETQDAGVHLAATDLEVSARVTVPATVVRQGALTLAARKLVELVRELPAEPITLALQPNGWVQLACGTAAFRLVGLPAEEYPPLDTGRTEGWLPVDGPRLRAMIARTSFAMSQDESRPFLNGLYLTLKGGLLRLVATDGHRLALAGQGVEADAELTAIVPRKAVQEMARVLATVPAAGAGEGVALAVRENQFFLRTPGFVLASKLVEGQFPNYEQVLPKALPRRLVVAREPLAAGLRRVSVVADDRTRPVRLTAAPGKLRLTASSQELGEAEEVLPADFAGEELTIGFNARYLLDALLPMEDERVEVDLKDGLSPGVFRGAGDDAHLCVIMPMRI
jgi:DNA polymerase-3 subunit beta